ncbi:Dyp-type peroxidase domain-containing protein [Variovorax sp. OV329]|uniref:Dyp-type peroxidase n=1 Tax=Variovorax sp. OV329 TaxID=1882825 RepID=UPI001587EE64|nr:Dyp-type peroxidase domain-containing protein [Variovorax sp. OV329]
MLTTKKDEAQESFRQGFDDIPAIVGTGLPQLRRARYLLVQVQEARAARQWLRELMNSAVVHSLARVRARAAPRRKPKEGPGPKPSRDVREMVTLAFSHAGLGVLGLKEDKRFPFPTAFAAGGASALRRRLLGDAQEPAWQWGDVASDAAFQAHIFVAHYWSETDVPQPLALLDPARLPAGLRALSVASCPSYIAAPSADPAVFEPFGFRDGIGQPVIEGMGLSRAEKKARDESAGLFDDRLIQPGEFVLGQVNEYGERAYCPNVEGWPRSASAESGFARNGTYLAVRQIEQHVAVFNRFTADHSVPMIGNLMVGRRKPDASCPHEAGYSVLGSTVPPSEIDAFRYLTLDANGLECPRGAHARRANPRDALGLRVEDGIAGAKLHRLLRRGRVYSEGCTQASGADACEGHPAGREGDTPCGRGLMFVALNTDFERQFEFVQKSWLAGSRFGDLSDEQDPLLGTDPQRSFSVQGCPVGERIGPLPRFTTVRGGGYFFAPSLTALRWMVQEKEMAALQPA